MRFQAAQWEVMAAQPDQYKSKREHHFCAMLLPNGKVFVGGGDKRRSAPFGPGYDYEIYVLPYIACGLTRRVITNPLPATTLQMSYFNPTLTYAIGYHPPCPRARRSLRWCS